MSTLSLPVAPLREGDLGRQRSNLKRWLIGAASVLAAAVAAAFFGINDYTSATTALVGAAQRNSTRFEAVYSDNAETKISTLRLGVDLILANPEITGAFTRDDRPALMKIALGLFQDTLQPKYGVSQFNFWTPPAKLFLRSTDSKEFGTDGSAARRAVVMANERRAPVSGMETGLGGRLTIRAIAPVMDGTRLVGVVELGDDLVALLRRARAATGVEFAAGLDRKRSEEVERPVDKAKDSIQGTDVFFEYSSEAAGRLVQGVSFNARDPAGQLVQSGGRSVYLRPFVINSFAGVPTVAVTTVADLTPQFAEARQTATVKGGILFVIVSLGAVLGLQQFQKLRDGFTRVVFGEHRKLQETTRALEIAQDKLKKAEIVKHGYFTNLVAAVTEPLQAVSGQLSAVLPFIEDKLCTAAALNETERGDLIGRFRFSLSEIERLARLLADYRRIELVRQDIERKPGGVAALSDAVSAAVEHDLTRFRRLRHLELSVDVPNTLPPVRVSQEHLRQMLSGLVGYAAQKGGQGTVRVVGSVDDGGWVKLVVNGSAFAGAGAPTGALLDGSRQFIARLSSGTPESDPHGVMMALILACTIAEKAGGRLEAASEADGGPGFVLRLPAAA